MRCERCHLLGATWLDCGKSFVDLWGHIQMHKKLEFIDETNAGLLFYACFPDWGKQSNPTTSASESSSQVKKDVSIKLEPPETEVVKRARVFVRPHPPTQPPAIQNPAAIDHSSQQQSVQSTGASRNGSGGKGQIRLRLNQLIRTHVAPGDRVKCQICCREIATGFSCLTATNHVMYHLNRTMFHCGVCEKHSQTWASIVQHMSQKHQLRGCESIIDESDQHADDLLDAMERCFGFGRKVPDGLPRSAAAANVQKPSTAQKHTRTVRAPIKLTIKRVASKSVVNLTSIFAELRSLVLSNITNGHLHCHVCNTDLRAPRFTQASLSHPMTHYDRYLFVCNHCEAKTKTLLAMKVHLQKAHTVSLSKNYRGENGVDWNELFQMFRKCYEKGYQQDDEDKKPMLVQTAMTTAEVVKAPKKAFAGDKTKLSTKPKRVIQSRRSQQIISFLQRLVARYGPQFDCHLCEKRFNVKCTWASAIYNCNNFVPAVDHACRTHLRKPLFECRYCHEGLHSKYDMYDHIRHKHADCTMGAAYVDHSRQFETEMLAMLDRCYGSGTGNASFGSDASETSHRQFVQLPDEAIGSQPAIVKYDEEAECSSWFDKKCICQFCGYSTRLPLLMRNHIRVVHKRAATF